MGWDAIVFGEVRVPERTLEAWLTAPVSPSAWGDWPQGLEGALAPTCPEALMEELSASQLQPHEFLDVSRDEAKVTLRGMLGQEAFLESRLQLATLIRSAEAFGGAGSLTFLGHRTVAFGYRLVVGWGGSRVRTLKPEEIPQVLWFCHRAGLDARAEGAIGQLLGVGPKATRKRGEPNPFTGW
jgi:hypothetical protein